MMNSHSTDCSPDQNRDKTVVCIATGPSLTSDDVKIVVDAKKDDTNLIVIGVNDSWKWKFDGTFLCDHIYAADQSFWEVHLPEMNKSGIKATRWMPQKKPFCEKNGIRHLTLRSNVSGLTKTPDTVSSGSHSGYQAINLAYHLGASRIFLLGYEMNVTDINKIHFFGNHPNGLRNNPRSYSKWIEYYKQLFNDLNAEQIDVLNYSRNSAIPYVPVRSVDTLMKELQKQRKHVCDE